MSRRYWIAFTAIGLALCLSSHGQAQSEERQAQAEVQSRDEQALPLAVPVRIIRSEAEEEAANRREQEANELQNRDVLAQQNMDATSTRMARYALWQTLLVFIGTVALIYTLYLTRKANQAAQGAIDVTRETGRDQSRAYLEIIEVRIPHGTGAQIVGTVLNQGSTPAKWYEVKAASRFQSAPETGPQQAILFDVEMPLGRTRRWTSPASGQTLTVGMLYGTDAASAKSVKIAERLQGYLILQGELRWETIYGEIYWSQFLFCTDQLAGWKLNTATLKQLKVKSSEPIKPIKMQRPSANLLTYQVEGAHEPN